MFTEIMTKVHLVVFRISHVVPVQDWLWKRADGVGKYYKTPMKFDGWRFDYVKGFTVGDKRLECKRWRFLWRIMDSNVKHFNDWANSAVALFLILPVITK
jgi:alpha-amylase